MTVCGVAVQHGRYDWGALESAFGPGSTSVARTLFGICFVDLRLETSKNMCIHRDFDNHVRKSFEFMVFEHHVANFFDGFLKKRVNVCRDKIRQNNA